MEKKYFEEVFLGLSISSLIVAIAISFFANAFGS
jgi:hypothetical protein